MAIKDLTQTKKCLFICNGGSCMKKDAEKVTQAIRCHIKDMNLEDEYHTVRTRCMGRCDDAPIAMLAPHNIWLQDIHSNECDLLLKIIQNNELKHSKHFLYQMGDAQINSDSISTNQRRNYKKQIL